MTESRSLIQRVRDFLKRSKSDKAEEGYEHDRESSARRKDPMEMGFGMLDRETPGRGQGRPPFS